MMKCIIVSDRNTEKGKGNQMRKRTIHKFFGKKGSRRLLITPLLFALLCSIITGCGSSGQETGYLKQENSDDYYDSYDYDSTEAAAESEVADYGLNDAVESKSAGASELEEGAAMEVEDTTSAGNGAVQDVNHKKDNKKIIKKYYYDYETENFDEAYAYLKKEIEQYNGYISSSEVNGISYRVLRLTARIPADVSDEFVGQLGSLGTMTSQSESADDVTLQYADTESRITSLKTEQERLNALLEKADSLEAIITLENRLTEVRYELENYQSRKNLYDDLISYSTVNITLDEVNYTVEVDDSSIISRISTGLQTTFRDIKENFSNFIVWFIVKLPYLVIWAVVIFVIVRIIRKRRKAKREKKQALTEQSVSVTESENMNSTGNEQKKNK